MDDGASEVFANKDSAIRNKWKLHLLPRPRNLEMFNGTLSQLTHWCWVTFQLGAHVFQEAAYVTTLAAPHDVTLGLKWRRTHDPVIDYQSLKIEKYRGKMPETAETATQIMALPPSTCPFAAFSAGGVLPAIEAEENRRNTAQRHAETLMKAQLLIEDALSFSQENLRLASAITLNGVSRNEANWKETIPEVYHRFAETVFSDESAAKLAKLRPGFDCEIQIKEGEKLSTCEVYKMTEEELKKLKLFLDEQVSKGFLKPNSRSTASSPVFFVYNGKTERLVIDFRSLNSKIVLDEYPIPLTRQILERLPRAKRFSKVDVRAGFYNIRIKPGDEWKTAIKTAYGLYEFQVMPMGLATAPSTFQRFINSVLHPYLGNFCFAYLDDIIIFSENEEEHEQHCITILEALEKAGLHLKPSKCEWNKERIGFLGFEAVAGKGICMAPDKIHAFKEWDPPSSIKEVRMMLGFSNFYHHLIPHYSDITTPLTNLTKKGATFKWDAACQTAFQTLQNAFQQDLLLAPWDPEFPIILETDASDVAYGGVIHQRQPDGTIKPILMYSHKFKDNEKSWTVAEKELYAIVHAFENFRYFLCGKHPLAVYSDHRNLAKFTTSLKLNDRQFRWHETLLKSGINYEIEYRPGMENTVADALSRYQQNASEPGHFLPLLPAARFTKKAMNDVLACRAGRLKKRSRHRLQIRPPKGFRPSLPRKL